MRLLVVVASSGVGREIVEQGLGHGHEIAAFVHGPPPELARERLRVLGGDARDRDALARAAAGAEAVLAAFGGPDASCRSKLCSDAMSSVVSAMKLQRVRRLVALSAAGVGESRASVPPAQRLRIATSRREAYTDLGRMEEVVLFSGLDWTVVRPAELSDGPLTGLYRVRDNVLPERGRTISRADVAALMLKALSSERYVGRIIAPAD
ncbi:MAG: NAD(P)H-binding protein [Coriobacteriia bacterium]|nr:NAD(P)H-binding protein [Coriobacteriia bacterium]